MNKPLNKGDYCVPRDAEERKLVLGIARMLGIAHHNAGDGSNEVFGAIWRSKFDDGPISDCSNCGWDRDPLSVPDFISGMYALAEERRREKEALPVGVGGIGQRLSTLEAEFIKVRGRLEELDAVVGESSSLTWFLRKQEAARSGRLLDGGSDHGWNTKDEEAMAELEKAKSDPTYFANKYVKVKGVEYYKLVDPKASPKNIPFEVALMYVRKGRKVRMMHESWNESHGREPHWHIGNIDARIGSISTCLEENWEVIPETK